MCLERFFGLGLLFLDPDLFEKINDFVDVALVFEPLQNINNLGVLISLLLQMFLYIKSESARHECFLICDLNFKLVLTNILMYN